MQIEQDKLKLYLKKREKYIKFKKFSGIAEIISGLSMLITLICSSVNITFVLWSGYLVSAIILLYGLLQLIVSLKNYFNADICFKEICNLDMANKRIQYIVILRENTEKGRFLLVYNIAWKCYLFPSYDAQMICKESVFDNDLLLGSIKDTFNISNQKINLKHIGNLEEYKMNVAEKCYMNYEFRFFLVENSHISKNKRIMKIKGLKFKWMSIDEMYKNKSIMKKNMKVVDYINNNTNISKI